MTIKDLASCDFLEVLNIGDSSRQIKKIYCCDLLSIAMSHAPEESAWITVMANINTLAVASLTDVSCVILAEGVTLDEHCLAKARAQNIAVFKTELPVFDAGLKLHLLIAGET